MTLASGKQSGWWVCWSKREMEESTGKRIRQWLRDVPSGVTGHEVEAEATKGLGMVKLHKGLLLCDFVIHNGVSDERGNWHHGAMATLIDVVGCLTAFSVIPCDNATVDLSISHFSTAKLQEEVEVEGKVVGEKERMTSVRVELRMKTTGELIALGKLWIAAANNKATSQPTSKL